jgi:hypothetical protein
MIGFIDPKLRASLRSRRVRAYATTALIAGLALVPAVALGAAQVSGTEAAVTVDAQNSSIKDVLVALGRQFNVHLQSTAALDKQISGTYEGPLRQVLARLLDGYNFIIRVRDGQLLVTVLGGSAPSKTAFATMAAAAPSPATQPAAPKSASAAEAAPTPSSEAAAGPNKAEVPAVASSTQSSGPVPTFKVAEGPPPVPTPSGSPSAGPVAGPPTSKMPMPTPGGATTSTTPIPAPGPSTSDVPTPSGTPVTPSAQTPQNK